MVRGRLQWAWDGSYWAAQSFPQPLPDLGFTPWLSAQRAQWLELSHWTGPIPQLVVAQDWVYAGKFREVFGQLTYGGVPVFGFHTTRYGAPTGGYGSLVYLDVLNAPAYGTGWRRENSFVTHKPSGVFCYGFYTFDPTRGGYHHPAGATGRRGPGVAEQYRLTAHGPASRRTSAGRAPRSDRTTGRIRRTSRWSSSRSIRSTSGVMPPAPRDTATSDLRQVASTAAGRFPTFHVAAASRPKASVGTTVRKR